MDADLTLLDRYATSRDTDAFSEIVRRHGAMVYAVARRVTGSAADAEDVVQACFVELMRRSRSIRGSVAGWLHRTATHRAADALRNQRTRARHERSAVDIAGNADDRESIDGILAHVDQALAELPDDYRVPLIEHYLRGRTQADVAEELSINQSTLSRRLARGVELLRERLARVGVAAAVMSLSAAIAHGADQPAPPAVTESLGKLAIAGVAPVRTTPVTAIAAAMLLVMVLGVLVAVTVRRGTPAPQSQVPQGVPVMATVPSATASPILHSARPTLPAGDVDVQIKFFRDVLGWKLDFQYGSPTEYAVFTRDGAAVAVTRKRAPFDQPASGYILISGIDAYHDQLKAAGANIGEPLRDWPYGMREFGVIDPFGNRLTFGQSTREPETRPTAPPQGAKTIGNTIPVLAVKDVNASMKWYAEKLGFTTEWGGEPGSAVGSVSRDGKPLMLQKRPAVTPVTVWIGSDVPAVYKQCVAGGLEFIQRPTNQPWALEMRIADPDGNVLWFGGDPVKGAPFGQVPDAYREAKQ